MSKKCSHCGECCKVLLNLNNHYIRTQVYCPGYNRATRRCDIYARRTEISTIIPGFACNTATDMIADRLQPSGCTMAHKSYRAKAITIHESIKDLQEEMDKHKDKVMTLKESTCT